MKSFGVENVVVQKVDEEENQALPDGGRGTHKGRGVSTLPSCTAGSRLSHLPPNLRNRSSALQRSALRVLLLFVEQVNSHSRRLSAVSEDGLCDRRSEVEERHVM